MERLKSGSAKASDRIRPVYTPAGGPPQGPRPSDEILPAIGEDGVFQMLEDLYAELADHRITANTQAR